MSSPSLSLAYQIKLEAWHRYHLKRCHHHEDILSTCPHQDQTYGTLNHSEGDNWDAAKSIQWEWNNNWKWDYGWCFSTRCVCFSASEATLLMITLGKTILYNYSWVSLILHQHSIMWTRDSVHSITWILSLLMRKTGVISSSNLQLRAHSSQSSQYSCTVEPRSMGHLWWSTLQQCIDNASATPLMYVGLQYSTCSMPASQSCMYKVALPFIMVLSAFTWALSDPAICIIAAGAQTDYRLTVVIYYSMHHFTAH